MAAASKRFTVNRLKLITILCDHHRNNHTSGNNAFLVEFIAKLLNLSGPELHRLADWISQMPPTGGDGS